MSLLKLKLTRTITLRSLLGLMVIIAIVFAIWSNKRSRHFKAMQYFSDFGLSRYENPIGPDWVSSYLSFKMPRSLCIDGIYGLRVVKRNFSLEEWRAVSDLQDLRAIAVERSMIPDGWVDSLTNCHSLMNLEISSCSISSHELSCFKKLRVLNVAISDIDLPSDDRRTLVESLISLEQLEFLVVSNIGLTESDLRHLKRELPNCEIVD